MKFPFVVFSFVLFISGTSKASQQDKIKYSYTLWIGDDIEKKFSMNLKSQRGIFFIDAMNEAAAKIPKLSFEATDSSEFGKFITSIGGYANVPGENIYWMLYNLTSRPDINCKPGNEFLSPLGVSSLLVADRGHYLFWLKTVTW